MSSWRNDYPRYDDYDLSYEDEWREAMSATRMLGLVLLFVFGLVILGAGIVIWLRVQSDAIQAAGL